MFMKKLTAGILAFVLLCTPVFADEEIRFDDVPDDHWAASYIYRMVGEGVLKGVGDNKFAPEDTLNYADFLTMIIRLFYSDKVQDADGEWYEPYITAAEDVEILNNVTVTPEDHISRYAVSQVMYNVLMQRGVESRKLEDTSVIADWANVPGEYQDSISTCYSLGLLEGRDDKGTYAGETFLTRAEAATVLCRLTDVRPIPEDAHVVTPDDLLAGNNGTFLDDSENTYSNGVFYMKHLDVNHAGHGIIVGTSGYTTLTFSVKAKYLGEGLDGEMAQSVSVVEGKVVPGWAWEDGSPVYESGEELLREDLVTGQVYTFSVDVSGMGRVGLTGGYGSFVDIEIWDIYLSN